MTGKVAVSWLFVQSAREFLPKVFVSVVYGKPLIPNGKDFVS
jgi:hypothetical protein